MKKHMQNWKEGKEWAGLVSQQRESNYGAHYQWLLAHESPLTAQPLRWEMEGRTNVKMFDTVVKLPALIKLEKNKITDF